MTDILSIVIAFVLTATLIGGGILSDYFEGKNDG